MRHGGWWLRIFARRVDVARDEGALDGQGRLGSTGPELLQPPPAPGPPPALSACRRRCAGPRRRAAPVALCRNRAASPTWAENAAAVPARSERERPTTPQMRL